MPKRKSLAALETPNLPAPKPAKAPKDRTHISIHMSEEIHRSVKLLAIHRGCRPNDVWIEAIVEKL
jgi:hypothetical protein